MHPIPVSDIDLFADDAIADPYPAYRVLRDLGPVVFLAKSGVHAMARYETVRDALRNHQAFSSAQGVAVDDARARKGVGNLLASDPPEHDRLRKVIMAPLSPTAVSAMRAEVSATAQKVVDGLVDKGSFEVVTEFAQALPLSIVSYMVGLPEEGRENMLKWASATFDALGPDNERSRLAQPLVDEMRSYAVDVAKRGKVKAGGWADRLLDLAESGEVEAERVPSLLRDFVGPALDTTILGASTLFYHLARNPDQWALLREKPELLRNAISEALRLDSPVRGMTRVATRDMEFEEYILPEGSRVLMLFGSANRDERKWSQPDDFLIDRKNSDHLGFGFGVHSCAGMHLARLEIESLFQALLARAKTLSVSEPRWLANNSLHGFSSLQAQVEAS